MMLKLMVIALLMSISYQRAYYNGWNQWKHNCQMCKTFMNIAVKEIIVLKNNADEVEKKIASLHNKMRSKCEGKNEDLCKLMLSIGFFMKNVLSIVNVNNIVDPYEICRHDDINFCPPNGRVSMYDTPEFPQLALDEVSLKNFSLVLQSMDKFEL